MLRKLRHRLILLLFLLLPFHALFVTSGTKVISGSGNPPLIWLALWKEGVIAALFLLIFAELFLIERRTIGRILRGNVQWTWSMDAATWCALGLVVLALLTQLRTAVPGLQWALGFKYLIFPVLVFLLLKQVPWDENFLERRVLPAILISGGVVALYGIITFFLPQSFFTFLGYSDAHSLYSPGSSLSAFQQISGTGIRRIQSTFAGPNQLGIWLLLPLSVGLVSRRKFYISSSPFSILNFSSFMLFTVAIAIFLTFSRSAWIAAFTIAIVAACMRIKGRAKIITLSSAAAFAAAALVAIFVMVPQLVQRGISNKHHFERTRDGIAAMFEKPLGHGLGTAGPASNRVSDSCVYFEEGADTSWAADRPDLCLFVGGVQTQPADRACECPVLPENWYVQVGYELGLFGFALFAALVVFVIRQLFIVRCSLSVALAFLGISIAALFLHAWEDSAVAYMVWGLAGILLSGGRGGHAVQRGHVAHEDEEALSSTFSRTVQSCMTGTRSL